MSYLFCKNKKEAIQLREEATQRIPELLREFECFFPTQGKVGITIKTEWEGVFYSVAADLTFNGEIVKSYPAFDLLELDLLQMEMNLMLKNKKNEGEKVHAK